MSSDPKSIERDIEETRDRLAKTIDDLAYRVNPKTIASREVATRKAFFVDPDSGAPRTDNIMKVAGGVAGVVVLFAIIRKVVRD